MVTARVRVVQVSSDVLPSPPKYGGAIETYIWDVSRVLSDMNVEVHIVSVSNGRETLVVNDNCYIHAYSLSRVENVLRIPRVSVYRNVLLLTIKLSSILSGIEKKYGVIDVVHCHYPATALASLLWRNMSRSKVKYVLTVHGEYSGNILDKVIFSNCDVICAVSNYIKRHIIQKFNIAPEKVKVIHNAVDIDLFKFNRRKAEKIREMLSLRNDPVLLYVGRIIPEKGIHKLIKVMPLILSKFPTTKLVIIGPPGEFSGKRYQYFSHICNLIKLLRIENSVRYLGSLPHQELVGVYSAADICVVPSILNEAFGLVVLEAMACSKPVVAFSAGGIPEIISDGVDGFLVARGNEEELASRIMFLLEHPEARVRIGKNARRKVEREFGYRNLVMKLIKEVYSL